MAVVLVLLGRIASGDGGYVWRGYERLREPEQKAIIVFDDGMEDLFLQVQYEGRVEDFGWLIPVPAEPEILPVTLNGFPVMTPIVTWWYNFGSYEYRTPLSKFIDDWYRSRAEAMGGAGGGGSVRVGSSRRVGDYEATVLRADDGAALRKWLSDNGFQVPEGGDGVLEDYVKRGWWFVACRIRVSARNAEKQRQLTLGELAPIHLRFRTRKPVYPLRISSLGKGASRVLVFLFARRLYAHSIFVPDRDSFLPKDELVQFLRKASEAERERVLAEKCEPTVFVTEKRLPEALKYETLRGAGHWRLSVFSREIATERMVEDLVFTSDPTFVESVMRTTRRVQLELGYGRPPPTLGADDVVPDRQPMVPVPFVVPDDLRDSFVKRLEKIGGDGRRMLPYNHDMPKILSAEEMEAYTAVFRKWVADRVVTRSFAAAVLDYLLVGNFLFDYCQTYEERESFLSLLTKAGVRPRYIREQPYPVARLCFRAVLKNPDVDMLRSLKSLPSWQAHLGGARDSALPFFRGVAIWGVSLGWGDRQAKLKSLSPHALQQLQALCRITGYRDPIAFDVLESWLGHREAIVRRIALATMASSINNTVQQCGSGGEMNFWGIRPHVCMSAYDRLAHNQAMLRPLLQDSDPECRRWAAISLAVLDDEKSVPEFLKILKSALRKDSSVDKQLVMAALVAASVKPHRDYVPVLAQLLKHCNPGEKEVVDYKHLVFRATAFIGYPKVREQLLAREKLVLLLPARQIVSHNVVDWLDTQIARTNDPYLRICRELFRSEWVDIGDPRTRNALVSAVEDPRLELGEYRKLCRRSAPSQEMSRRHRVHWSSTRDVGVALLRGMLKHPDDFLAEDMESRNPRYRLPLICWPTVSMPGRLALTRRIMQHVDGLDNVYGWGAWGPGLEWVAARLDIFNNDLVAAYMRSFPEGDINRRLCGQTLRIMADLYSPDGTNPINSLGTEWKAYRTAMLSNPHVTPRTVYYASSACDSRYLWPKGPEFERLIGLVRMEPLDVDAAVLMWGILAHHKPSVLIIQKQLAGRTELSWREQYLKKCVSVALEECPWWRE